MSARVSHRASRAARIRRVAVAALAGLASVSATSFALAQNNNMDCPPVALGTGKVSVAIGHSTIFDAKASYGEVFIGSSDIADVMPVTANNVYVLGKKVGTTNIRLFDKCKTAIGIFDVEVTPDVAFIQQKIRQAVPAARGVTVTSANGSLVINGTVPDAPTAEKAVSIASAFTKDVVNILQVSSPQQVLLEVRVVEASRNAGRELGVRWDFQDRSGSGYGAQTGAQNVYNSERKLVLPAATQLLSGSSPFGVIFANIARSGNLNLDVTIEALEEKGLVRRLANPNLTALSGSTASFLAGGEFPVPVAATSQGGVTQTTIQFKKFGVMLDFMPTVLANGQISLKVTPEVSELDYANAVRNAGVTIPSIVARRASTEIILKTGQSFAIAGLLAETGRTQGAQVPWLGDVPVLGALFRSQGYQKRETELVIFVTAHLAKPGTPRDRIATPHDKTLMGNDADIFLKGKSEVPKKYDVFKDKGQVSGPYGHILDVERGK